MHLVRNGFFQLTDSTAKHRASHAALLAIMSLVNGAHADYPFAHTVVSFTAGSGAATGFNLPAVALGPPERFTGEGISPMCVTPFSPAYRPNEIVSLGVGGELVLRFDHDVLDDPRNPFGIDLIVFGNAFFTDATGTGMVAGLAAEGGVIAVSLDGIAWTSVPLTVADGLFPTRGYMDVLPYATQPGTIETNFLRPVNPALSMRDLSGLDYESCVALNDGSGGGAGIDLAALGLPRIRFVRISNSVIGSSPEIDAVSDVEAITRSPDLDGDGVVGASDLARVLGAWGTMNAEADLDFDGVIGAGDLSMLLGAWGTKGGA